MTVKLMKRGDNPAGKIKSRKFTKQGARIIGPSLTGGVFLHVNPIHAADIESGLAQNP
ncbi:hypothetical protein PtA15_2A744 [Puccinia triticina]|uniref:Uncharacterized protein n=1 Tax=Puccinia triticina TaxID=208348 RepID=A0ABY7CER6_9BASI|nr:uncharacterized protein PtA15_2A744 [Puccinia triticina]WAQ82427.1 hypothetical protein PtA15_2A744 [Puccinia triticina]